MKIVIVSGYFNPLHGGHLDLLDAAAKLGDKLVVIVNNDQQQLTRKGKIILDENDRLRLMKALRSVDDVVLSVDNDMSVVNTLKIVAEKYKGEQLVFANGGKTDPGRAIPETPVCRELGIEMMFEVGGSVKYDSSTRINRATGHEQV